MCVLPKIVYQGYTWQAYALIAIHHVTDKKPLAGWCHNYTGNGRNLRYRSPTHVGISGPVLPTIGNATTMYVHISKLECVSSTLGSSDVEFMGNIWSC